MPAMLGLVFPSPLPTLPMLAQHLEYISTRGNARVTHDDMLDAFTHESDLIRSDRRGSVRCNVVPGRLSWISTT
ncbi:hypothetical protein EDD37DRAFT_640408 [Exophiala viscosa]|uniref:uncharacterized protein n=1 Tax=Exophiala viscosa TaxID=2486360 RepID=UPI002190997A|nr:hypothetical protein EDD37DRAFT_640408 [Exophiala viscosa]